MDHITAPKHTDNVKTATERTRSRGYDEVVDWIVKDVQEVINVASSSPAKKPKTRPEKSDDDDQASGVGEPTDTLLPVIAFADWPFALLEVDLSTKKQKDHWGPMDPDMAEAIRHEAQQGNTQFEISLMIKNLVWIYKMDFVTWTQENVASGKVRKFRFAKP